MDSPYLRFIAVFHRALFFVVTCLLIGPVEGRTESVPWTEREFQAFGLASEGHDLTLESLEDCSWRIRTTGTDPYLRTTDLVEKLDPDVAYRILFQYQAPEDLGDFQVLYETPGGLRHLNQDLAPSTNWRWHAFDLADGKHGLGEAVNWLRFDFGNRPDATFRVRDLRLIRRYPEFDPAVLEHLPFELQPSGNQLQATPLEAGGWELRSTGSDPYIRVQGLVEQMDPQTPYLLAFEYQTGPDADPISIHFLTESGTRHQTLETEATSDWTWHLHDLSIDGAGLGGPVQWLRFDFGNVPDATYRIRSLRLIPATLELRQRAELGAQYKKLNRFGIGLKNLKPQPSGVETLRHADPQGLTVTLSAYRHLDLDAETKRLSDTDSTRPPVPLAPRIVVGEGEHPDNHTVVRILSPYQVCEAQFLAYPPEIRGGVGLETGRDGKGEAFIVAHPLSSMDSRELHLFNTAGGFREVLTMPKELSPPFTVAVGDWIPDQEGDEIAVATRFSRTGEPAVHVFAPSGEALANLQRPGGENSEHLQEFQLFARSDGRLVIQNLAHKQAEVLIPEGETSPIDFRRSPKGARLFDTLHEDREFNLGGPEPRVSTLHPWKAGELQPPLDVGRMENIFWFDPQEVHNGDWATWGTFPDGIYVRNFKYNYLGSAQYWSPLVRTGEIEDRSYEEWVEGIDWERNAFGGDWRKSLDEYDEGVPTLWNASFSHRWSVPAVRALSSQVDPQTQLPRYLLLDRTNQPTGGGYFGKRLFDYGTQNFEQESINRFYTYAQRAFYRRLAPLYRANPEMTVAVEPNHENEIVSGRRSVGDYHPKSLEGFYHYLTALYGGLDSLNRAFGTTFTTDFFDAPRGLLRGEWDRYDPANPLFCEWVEYNRIQVYRRVGTSYREALLAGFPPELIKSHQIPDSYVFGSIVGISEGEVRISPIDWLLTTGAGFGFSRYGTYFEREHNIGQGAHSSGFDGMLVGEYASLNPSHQKALGQLLYLRDHGVSALHVMWWPTDWDKGYNDAQASALRELIENHDQPKPGLAGGLQQVRSWRGRDSSYEIVSLGGGAEHTGLIKSIRADGSFEGTVYAVPFHAQVGIRQLRAPSELQLSDEPTAVATVQDLRQGAVLEVTFEVGQNPGSTPLNLSLRHVDATLSGTSVELADLKEGQKIRVMYKLPLILEELSLLLGPGSATLKDLQVIHHQDQTINLTRGIMEGQRHQGGVSFALLPQE